MLMSQETEIEPTQKKVNPYILYWNFDPALINKCKNKLLKIDFRSGYSIAGSILTLGSKINSDPESRFIKLKIRSKHPGPDLQSYLKPEFDIHLLSYIACVPCVGKHTSWFENL